MTPITDPQASAAGAACCTAVYELDWVRVLLDHSFHPGGEELTQSSFAGLDLAPGEHLADIGCGTGSSALQLAERHDVRITGVDLSPSNAAEAKRRLNGSARLVCGDATALPFSDHSFQGLIAECSFSLSLDQAATLSEFHRVLAPGRRLALSDMSLEGELAPDLADVAAPWTCLVGAHSQSSYVELFESHGFRVLNDRNESAGLLDMIDRIKRRLLLAGTGLALSGPADLPAFDLATVRHWLARVKDEVQAGRISYLAFLLERS